MQTTKQKILWLEDDQRFVDLLREDFEHYFDVVNYKKHTDILALTENEIIEYSAILLDLELVDGRNDIKTIEYLKSPSITIPILVLSNDESIATKLRTLKLGIDDYLYKFMHPDEMLLRLKNAIARNQPRNKNHVLSLAGIKIDTLNLTLNLHKETIESTKTELQLLIHLIDQFPKPLSFEFLRDQIWRAKNVEMGTINTFIWKINKKLLDWQYRLQKDKDFICLVQKDK